MGVAELGVIAGGGILLCALAELTVLPAAIFLVDRSNLGRRMPEPLAVHIWIQPMLRVPRLTLFVGVAFTAVLAWGLGKLWYDNNLLNMQAVGLESVELERRLLDECHQSSWYALSIADTPEQLAGPQGPISAVAVGGANRGDRVADSGATSPPSSRWFKGSRAGWKRLPTMCR